MTLKAFYGLPKKVVFCKKTLISNQLPNSAIEFKHTIRVKKKKPHLLIKMEFLIHGNIQE